MDKTMEKEYKWRADEKLLGQALLAKKMGKTRLIAETGADQHGVATATAAALMGRDCVPHVKAYVKSMKDAVRSAN